MLCTQRAAVMGEEDDLGGFPPPVALERQNLSKWIMVGLFPAPPPHRGPGTLPSVNGLPAPGLTTGLIGAAAVWAPHLHQGSAHATLHLGTAEALTHCMGEEAGDRHISHRQRRALILRNATLAKEGVAPSSSLAEAHPLHVLRNPRRLESRGEVWAPRVSP